MGLLRGVADFFEAPTLLGGEAPPEVKGLFNSPSVSSAQGLLAGVFPYGTPPRRGTRELIQTYKQQPWLQSAVHRIALDVASTPLRLLAPARGANKSKAFQIRDAAGAVRKGLVDQALRAGELRVIEQHPFLDLLHQMNPALRGLPSRFVTQVYIELTGETFWVKEKNGLGLPLELWPIPPHWVIMTPAFKMPYFRMSWMGWNRTFDEDDVLWIRSPDPENPYWRGTGLGVALGDELDIDIYAQRHIKSWFYNRALPDAIISVDGLTDEARAKEYEERLRSKHQGVGRGHQIHVASGKVEVQQLQQTFKEQQMTETRSQQRDTILSVLNIPPEVMGIIENSNRATIGAAYFLYTSGVLVPRLDFLCDQLQPLAQEYDESLIADYLSPVPEDTEFKLKAYQAAPWAHSKNEWRAMAGDQPLPGGDDVFPPMPTGGGAPFGAGDGKEGEGDSGKGGKGKKKPKNDDDDDEGKAAPPAVRKDERVDVANVLDALRPDRLTDAVDAPFRGQLELWGKRVLDELGSGATFDMRNPLIRHQVSQLAGQKISGINRTTRNILRGTLEEGVAAGEGVADLKARVGAVFDDAEGWRAEMIARTEVVGASNAANVAAFSMSGVVGAKEWLAVKDGETRDTHRSMDGQVRMLGEMFVADNGNAAEYPGGFGEADQDINCRCSVLPVVDPDKALHYSEQKRTAQERVQAFLSHEGARKPFEAVLKKAFARGFAQQREDVLRALR